MEEGTDRSLARRKGSARAQKSAAARRPPREIRRLPRESSRGKGLSTSKQTEKSVLPCSYEKKRKSALAGAAKITALEGGRPSMPARTRERSARRESRPNCGGRLPKDGGPAAEGRLWCRRRAGWSRRRPEGTLATGAEKGGAANRQRGSRHDHGERSRIGLSRDERDHELTGHGGMPPGTRGFSFAGRHDLILRKAESARKKLCRPR